ncbi:geranylgeranylglycerol-phosphate geranylgeranyltransferase [Flavihumibacter solisilvae]|uniref:Ubiquinone biosynthesis protein UbiA n=1 Tax=Flavihumibacter solisilvae TaxID=1349421 RepID=A0A0C1L2L3_9BACT|nr:geranylgeranylglycerol-phosphate geranylgeranyltransferase [Flavihumibacter solisilvae]KIC93836.1 ubiquinone biosynthesis protein UbiA [Flavihumibacter solisilvae]
MKLIGAFFRLIRWPNLFFIIITQVLFYYCILLPSMGGVVKLDPVHFSLLILSSVLIAAAGYIINDYFDLNIDQVNKPDSIVIQRVIRRRWAIAWHLLLSLAGVLLAFYLSWKLRNPIIGFANFGCALLLWLYSTTFKRQLLIGNVLISLLTAWVILVIYFAELSVTRMGEPAYRNSMNTVFKFTIIYSSFAFIISLVREVVKDLEDRIGDERYGCRTMPIVWGVPATRMFVGVWMFVMGAALLIMQVYGLLKGWWMGAVFCLFTVIVPLVTTMLKLRQSNTPDEFHRLSSNIKWIMLAGILSMVFFKFYL